MAALLLLLLLQRVLSGDIPCQWDSKAGSTFDLRTLIVPNYAYTIVDGDIPCTPQSEPSYDYVWNFCTPIPSAYIPTNCIIRNKTGVAIQYLQRSNYQECHIIGKYDASNDDIIYSLLDVSDPSKGISMKYANGDKCEAAQYKGKYRSATIDIQCANTKTIILSAEEPSTCAYHLVMKSYYGCPSECPVTSTGLCSSHGYCKFDKSQKKSYCYCNQGYYGSSCSSTADPAASSSETYDGYSVQLGLLITLVLAAVGLLGVMGFMVYRITQFRKEQVNEYATLAGTEMTVNTLHF